MATINKPAPQRQRTKRVEGGPQGEGAWIEIIMPTINENKTHNAMLMDLSKSDPDEANNQANLYFARHVKSWNWVDDDGAQLPDPSKNPELFENLLPDELVYITLLLNGQDPDALTRKKK